jgi:hypothetical protein
MDEVLHIALSNKRLRMRNRRPASA